MGFVVELTDPKDHPLRRKATKCAECGTDAVFFNSGNVVVQCHACGVISGAPDVNQYHLRVWVSAMGYANLLCTCGENEACSDCA